MTQLDLLQPVRMPEDGQLKALLLEMKKRPVTLWTAIHDLGIGSLSRRICDLKELGWPINDRWVTTHTGKRVKEYWV